MSVLPQLERELLAAHARRRRRPWIGRGRARPRIGRGWAPVALAAAVTVAVVVIAAVTLRSGRSPVRPAAAAAIVYRGRLDLAYAGGGSLYGAPFASTGLFHLVRIDPDAGRVVADVRLTAPATHLAGGGYFQPVAVPESMLLADGSLWVNTVGSQHSWLWRLDPRSLAVRSRSLLTGGAGGSGSLAVAGGWLWVVNGNTLVRVSLATGRVAGSRVFAHAEAGLGNSIAADPAGHTLVATAATGIVHGRAGSRVYRLDPGTGRPLAASARFHGAPPELAGVIDGGAWINNGLTAADGPVRVDVRTLKVTATLGRFPRVAQVFDGIVEVDGDGASRCVDPVSGRVLATLPAVVAAEGSTAYVLRARPGGGSEIRREALDPSCLTRH